MKLIFIYGPPASGKLTVAQELAKLVGYPVFHNHLTRNLVQAIYPGELAANYQLVDTLREDVLSYCARNGTNLIFTFVYDGPQDDRVVNARIGAVRAHGGEVLFVELIAPQHVLLERVSNVSRAQHNKLTDRAVLASLLGHVSYPSLPYPGVFKIDTSQCEPSMAATLIDSHFQLSGS